MKALVTANLDDWALNYLREELERTRAAEEGSGEIATVGANGHDAAGADATA